MTRQEAMKMIGYLVMALQGQPKDAVANAIEEICIEMCNELPTEEDYREFIDADW